MKKFDTLYSEYSEYLFENREHVLHKQHGHYSVNVYKYDGSYFIFEIVDETDKKSYQSQKVEINKAKRVYSDIKKYITMNMSAREIINSISYSINEKKSPCWDGYEKVKGKKDYEKGSCRKKESKKKTVTEAKGSQCTKVTQKTSSSRKDKKWMKCAKQPDGSIKKKHWGDPNAKVTGKSGNTKRKKAFRARHGCSSAKKGSAKALACADW